MENARQLEVNVYRRVPGARVGLEVLRGTEKRALLGHGRASAPGDPERFADRIDPKLNSIDRLGVMAIDLDDDVARLLPGLRARAGVVVATADARAAGTLAAGRRDLRRQRRAREERRGPARGARAVSSPARRSCCRSSADGALRYVTVEPD